MGKNNSGKGGRPRKYVEKRGGVYFLLPEPLRVRMVERCKELRVSQNDYITLLMVNDTGTPPENIFIIQKPTEDESMTNRAKNLDTTIELIDRERYSHIERIKKIISMELGLTEKKVMEYIELLAFNKKIRMENGWVVSTRYEGPMPWTDKFAEEKLRPSAPAPPPSPDEITPEETAALETSKAPEHVHEGPAFSCSTCGKEICTKCADTFIQTNGVYTGKCRGCT